MSTDVIGVALTGEIQGLRDEFSKIPKTTDEQLKAALALANKRLNAIEKAAAATAKNVAGSTKKMGEEVKKGTDALKDFGDAAGNAGGNAGKLAGALGMVSPEAAEVAQSFADIGDVGEVASKAAEAVGLAMSELTVLLGVAGVAVAAVGAAYMVHSRNAEIAADRTALLARESAALAVQIDRLEDAGLRRAVAEGRLSEAGAEQIRITRDANRAVGELAKGMAEERKAAEEAFEWNGKVATALEKVGTSGSLAGAAFATAADWLGGFTAKTDAAAIKLADLNDSYDAQKEKINQTAEADRKAAEADEKRREAEEEARKAREAHTKAMARQEAAFATLEEAAATEADRYARVTSGITSLIAATKSDEDAQLSKAQKLDAAHDEEIRKIGEVAGAALLASRGELERKEITTAAAEARAAENARYYDDLKALDAELTKKVEDNAKKRADAERKHLDEVRELSADVAISVADTIGSLSSTLSDVFGRNAEELARTLEEQGDQMTGSEKAEHKKRLEAAKEAALTAFRVQQAAAIAAATITTAMMAINAYNAGLQAGGPAGLVLGPAMAIVAGAAGAAQIAAIASQPPPSFDDTPGIQRMGKKRGLVSLKEDDYYVAAQRPEDLRRQVGAEGGTTTVVLYNQHKHRIFDRQVRENIRAGGGLSAFAGASRSWRRGG